VRVRPGSTVWLETAPLFAEAIRRIHGGGSIVDLLALGSDEK